MTSSQRLLELWEGDFGRKYTDRNVIDWRILEPAFQVMLEGLPVERVLEIGCNRGHNLIAVSAVLGEEAEIVGLEPNPYALDLARAAGAPLTLVTGHAGEIPFDDGYFDLVFTCGVLIHVPPESLSQAIAEMSRVSRRYILAIEYFSAAEMAVPYRGRPGILWKRDFASYFRTQLPALSLIRSGYWGPEHGFDRTHWWLFVKE